MVKAIRARNLLAALLNFAVAITTTVAHAASGGRPLEHLQVTVGVAEREWAYDRMSSIGKLDKAWDEAQAKGWTVVDMKQEWKTIYPAEKH